MVSGQACKEQNGVTYLIRHIRFISMYIIIYIALRLRKKQGSSSLVTASLVWNLSGRHARTYGSLIRKWWRQLRLGEILDIEHDDIDTPTDP